MTGMIRMDLRKSMIGTNEPSVAAGRMTLRMRELGFGKRMIW